MTTDHPATRGEHDRAVRAIAATRFPFPGQVDWPADYVTLHRAAGPTRAVAVPGADEVSPDIVIVDGKGAIREIGEVETDRDLGDEAGLIRKWSALSLACDDNTESGSRHFFVYVPEGREEPARRLLERNGISYAGLRTYRTDPSGAVQITPIVTPAGPKDHR